MTARLRVGLLGVDTSHAEAFGSILADSPEVAGVHLWGADAIARREVARRAGLHEHAGPARELADQVDLALVLHQAGQGAQHNALAAPFLDAGVPVFVDKPLGPDPARARQLFRTARERGTPLFSASALRFAPGVSAWIARAAEVDALTASAAGPGRWESYAIHTLELTLAVFPIPVARVWRQRRGVQELLLLDAADGRSALVIIDDRIEPAFSLTVRGRTGRLQAEVDDVLPAYQGLIAACLRFARTGEAPVTPAQTLAVLDVLDAGRRALIDGSPAEVRADPV